MPSSPIQNMTLDALMSELQAQKDAGMPGNTRIFLTGHSSGFATQATRVGQLSVAKPDHESGRTMCKIVSNRGVPVLTIN